MVLIFPAQYEDIKLYIFMLSSRVVIQTYFTHYRARFLMQLGKRN